MKISTLPSKSHLVARLIAGAAIASALIQTSLHAIEHGTVEVDESAATTYTLQPSATPGVTIDDRSNRGDYWLEIVPAVGTSEGVLISTIAENGRDGVRYPTSSGYPADPIANPDRQNIHYISLHEPRRNGNTEDNANVAFAFFSFAEFVGGIFDTPTGNFNLDLTSGHPERASDKGVLLVGGAANRNNYALSRADSDGTFTIFNHDNGVNADSYETGPVAYTFIPVDHGRSDIIAMGRIAGSGQPVDDDSDNPIASGDFTITKDADGGLWYLTIPGRSNLNGTLVLSPEGGSGTNVDNIWSYEWDPQFNHFTIESRDIPTDEAGLPATARQNIPDGTPAFSFVYLASTPEILYVDQNVSGGGGDGISWANAYPNLQQALTVAIPGQEIWVAQGTYYPDEGPDQTDNDRASNFALKSGVKIYGGFPTAGSSFGSRDPVTNQTILSGDLNQDDGANFTNNSENALNVLIATATDELALLNGFTVTAGNAGGASSINDGGGLRCGSLAALTISDCSFQGNTANRSGGAVSNSGSPTFINCSFLGNFSDSGGAIQSYSESSPPPSFTNCSFQGNSATNGGAINATSPAGSPTTFTNCSFQGNSASSSGGAIRSDTSTSLTNCILWNNTENGITTSAGASIANSTNSFTYSHCLIENWDATSLGDSTSLDGISDTDNNGTKDNDPRFLSEVDPANAPTLGGNLRLGASSPAVGVGNISQIPTSITTDLAGAPRIFGIGIDLGAYEAPDQLGAYITDVRQSEPAGTSDGRSNWVPDFSSGGYTFDITPTSSLGSISFDDPPAVSTAGSLSFTLTAETSGIAYFQVIIRDSNNVLAPSLPYQFSIRSSDITWHVDQSAIGQADGASWENAFTSLDAALEIAFQGDQIWIAEGTYIPSDASGFTISIKIDLFGGFSAGGGDGTFAARDPDPATNNTILSGDLDGDGDSTWPDPDNADHIITFTAGSIDGFTITRGNANGTGGAMNGGGIYSQGGDVKIQNVILINNHATTRGGGFYGSSVDVNMRNVIFDSNTSAGNGGGMHTAILPASAGFTNVILRNNHATNDGGGSYSAGEGGGTYTNCLFHDNSAGRDGGGSYSGGRSRNNYLNCTVANNTATRDYGGLRAEVDQGEPGDEEFVDDTLINTIVWGNSASNIPDTRATDFDRSISNHIGGADPLFVNPSTNDYRLLRGSPAVEVGSNGYNSEPTDLAGGPRRRGFIIDLGAYEGRVGATFALLHPNLDPDADDNGNGMSNYGDYAAGNDPTTTSPAPRPQLDSQLILTYSSRYNASDVESTLQKSFTLQPGSWSDLTRDEIDAISYTTFQGKGTQTSQLNFDPETIPRLFIRQLFFVPET